MGVIQRAGDLVYTFRFLTLLVTKFEKTKAFQLGLIDKDGKRIKEQPIDTSDKKSAYTPFHRLVFNIKRLMAKVPGGSSSLASYAAALYLIKEKLELSDKSLKQIVEKCGLETLDFLTESSEWFVLEDKSISAGVYSLKYDKVVNSTVEEIARSKDKIRFNENTYPVGQIFGLDIYEATHINTNQKVFVAIEELLR